MKGFKIGNRSVGSPDDPTYIIAEAGSNHNNSLEIAKQLVDAAVDAKADAIKFQTFRADCHYSKNTPKFSTYEQEPYNLIKDLEIPLSWHDELLEYGKKKKIDVFTSPAYFEAVDYVEKLGVVAHKVGSFEAIDPFLIAYIAKTMKPIIVSVGMCTLGEIEDIIEWVDKTGNNSLALLHCNSLYPTPPHICNLNVLTTMQQAFDCVIGYSDHTMGIHIPVAAVTLGAKIIEKHFTLSRDMEGPDHAHSIEPDEFKQMVQNIRAVETALGSSLKKISPEEKENYRLGRRGLCAANDILKGTKITEDMICVKRPGYGIKPKYFSMVVGRIASKDIKNDDILTWDML